MADLLCMGEPLLEYNEQPDGSTVKGFGGDTTNCAVAAARSGASVGIFTSLGKDEAGDDFIALWAAEGINTDRVLRSFAPTGTYRVTHGPDGHDFHYAREGSAAARMGSWDVSRDIVKDCKILHASGISQAISVSAADAVIKAIRYTKDAGGRVSYDTNLRLKLWPLDRARAIIHSTVAECDIVLPGLDDAQQLTGLQTPDEIVDFYLDLGPSVVALTLGPDGTLVATKDDRQMVAGHPVNAVDATGAGDTFDGAFLARLLAGDTPFAAASYANAAAALSTQGYGAVAPMPQTSDVKSFLASRV